MTHSKTLAGLIGPAMLLMAAALVLNADLMPAMVTDASQSYGLLLLAGFMVFVAGVAIVRAHNLWTRDWRVMITITGWLCMFGGVTRALFPRQLLAIAPRALESTIFLPAAAGVLALAGAFLTYQSLRPQT